MLSLRSCELNTREKTWWENEVSHWPCTTYFQHSIFMNFIVIKYVILTVILIFLWTYQIHDCGNEICHGYDLDLILCCRFDYHGYVNVIYPSSVHVILSEIFSRRDSLSGFHETSHCGYGFAISFQLVICCESHETCYDYAMNDEILI